MSLLGQYNVDYRISLGETCIIKGVAIIAMLFHHLFYQHPEYGESTVVLAEACKVCVALFVFLSGYGMAISFPQNNRNKIKTNIFFLCKRYVKFLLNYWFIFFITVPLGVFIFGRPLEEAYGENVNVFYSLIGDILGRQGLNSYNITWWFNAVILTLWILFPLLYWLMKNSFVAIWVLTLFFINPEDIMYPMHRLAFGFPSYILSYSVGIFVALHIKAIAKYVNRLHPIFVLFFSLVATIFLLYLRGVLVFDFFCKFRVDPFATIFIVLSIICICRITKRKFHILQYIGKHSINMYLIHTFIFGYFFSEFIYGFRYPVLIFFALLVSSLFVSICIEFIKTKIGFYRLQNKVVDIVNKGLG